MGVGNVTVKINFGLTVDFVNKEKCKLILRGLRGESDFEQEWIVAQTNKKLDFEIETVFMCASLEQSIVSSRIVKEVASNQGELNALVPAPVEKALKERFFGSST